MAKKTNPPVEPPTARAPMPEASEAEKPKADLGMELGKIYSEQGAGPLDMSKLDQTRHSTVKKALIGLIVFFGMLAAVSWAGFFFFSPSSGKFSGEGVALEIEGPSAVKSGEVTAFVVRWKNNERVALGTASFEMKLPKDFVLQRSEPAITDGMLRIGSVASEKEGRLTLTGIFLAPLEKEMVLQGVLTYRPADFNSEFQKVATKAVTVNDSVFDLAVSGPPKLLPGDTVTLQLSFRNSSENTFEGVRLRAIYPASFIPESSSPKAATAAHDEWRIAKIGPGEEAEFTVTGSFASDAKGKIEVAAELGFIDKNEEFALQERATATADVLEGDLVTVLILNGKPEEQSVSFGETLHYALSYRNTGNVGLEDVSFTVRFEADPAASSVLKWNDLKDREEGVRDGDTITWTKKQVSSLAKLAPGDEGTVNFDLPVLDAPIAGTTGKDYRVTSWVESTVKTIDGADVSRTAKTQPIIARFLSDAKLAADARYYNDDGIPVGSGPLPPVVGQPTTYRVSWQVSNSLHELTDLKLSAKLPANAAWNGRSTVDAGDLRFDAAAEKMIWTLNWLPTTIKTLAISFDLALTPEETQVGKVASLLDATILEAKDKVTGSSVLLSSPPMTTSLENDEGAAGKGRVLAQ